MFRVHIQSRFRGIASRMLAELTVGAAAAILAVLLRDLLVPLTGRSAPYALNFVAAVIATLFAGWRAGVVAVIIGQLATWYLIVEPSFEFQLPDPREGWSIALATAAELFIIAIVGRYQERVDRAWAELNREHELRGVLLFELNHRVKNTLALVQGIAQQTFRGRADDELAQAFHLRIDALAQTHDLLTQREWTGAELREIIAQSVHPLMPAGDRLTVDGPFLVLPPKACLSLAMVFHELATNSLKYGALSGGSGQVSVRWTNRPSSGFAMQWEEVGGPPTKAPKRRGFGTRLIEKSMAAELGASVTMNFDSAGFSCVIEGPYLSQPTPEAREESSMSSIPSVTGPIARPAV